MIVDISINGCDDSTVIKGLELRVWEYDTLVRIADLVDDASDFGCQPTMSVELVKS